MIRRLVLGALFVLAAVPVMAAGRYSADRYDSRIEVLRGGTIRVTETIAIQFETGSFSQFYRAIPTRMTDGIEIVSASMDGMPMPQGSGPGHIQISGSSIVRVTWRFAVTSPATHTFGVTYLARGTVRHEEDADLVAWNILPVEHTYRIAVGATDITLPEAPSATPSIDVRRLSGSSVDADGRHIRIEANGIRANGWLRVSIRLPRGSVIDTPPQWQQRQAEIRRLSSQWAYAAALLFVSGLALLFFVRQRYDPPPRESSPATPWSTMAPDPLPPPIAGALLTNGGPRLEHAMAALFALADRGELRIDERSGVFGYRDFTIVGTPTRRPLAPYEDRLLEIMFVGGPDQSPSVSLSKARNRVLRHFRKFKAALEPAMVSAGLLDQDRRAVRRRFVVIAVGCLTGASLSSIAFAFITDLFGGWPMLIPLALGLVGVLALLCFAAHTPLSNEGARRAHTWRGFRGYLRAVARDREPSPGDAAVRQLLPFAVAFGIAPVWSGYLKRHGSAAPPWFRAATDASNNSAVAFSAFVGSGGSGASGGGHGAATAAAGGGSSGAA